MISLIIGIVVSLGVTIVGTPLLIRLVHKLNYGQYIRQDGPKSHLRQAWHAYVGWRGHQSGGCVGLGLVGVVSLRH